MLDLQIIRLFLIIFVDYVLHYYSFVDLCSFIRYTETEYLHSYSICLLLNFYMNNLMTNFSLQTNVQGYQRKE